MYVGAPQHPDTTQTGRATTPSLGFAMVPKDVRDDRRLTHRDLHVYMEIAAAERGGHANIGERRLAKLARVDRRSLRGVIARLVEFGHVEIEEQDAKVRAWYHLTSPRFASLVTVPEIDPGCIKEALDTCPKCGKGCHGLLKAGWCRSCNWFVKMDPLVRRLVRQEIAAEKIA